MLSFRWISSTSGYVCIQMCCLTVLMTAVLPGCSNKRINNLQGSVDTLETQLKQFQQTAQQETEFTTTSLSELQKEISQAFRDIRYSQTNLESILEQLSNRLSLVEKQTTQIQSTLTHLNTQASDNFNTANINIQDLRNETHRNLNEHNETIRNMIASIQRETEALKNQDQTLQSQIHSMDQENRKVFERILKELGTGAPTSTPSSGSSVPSSGKTYTVQAGDNLSKIAVNLGVSMADLQRANNISDPSLIKVGQVLQIP